ncbi:cell wall-binding repeat-containing protein [Desulfosporosinus youngiae]|uniref:Cell wall-binding protein n=1 Tax=Desulfosporosinus youngiae DSM 17734 TaxID=768710 RepID=H5XZK4_9FIRM|nr:cell wall-binding repeat-containing protein [Desulfosporosinus youngiae]EHQ91978.1 cell wall-binding protein [Desulfosporosinus youngiae DSM 17734]
MKKTKKALATLAIAGMTLSMIPFNVFAAAPVPTRIAGVTAEQTAVKIADQTGYTGTAVLASSTSYGMVDALTAGPLAASLKAPILLTGAGDTLDAATKAELTKLEVKKVYVTSGTAVIKQGVIDELKAMGIEVEALGGYDRAETSVNIAKKMTGVTKVAIANTVPDALSIASVAAAANQAILLTDKDALPASVASYLTSAGITSSDVIGGSGVISDTVVAGLPGATRHYGMTAYDTNNQVIKDFAAGLAFDNVYVANGVTGIDALAGAPLAAQTKSPIVLTDGKTVPAAAAFTYSKSPASAVVTALGGEFVVPESVRAGVAAGQVTPDTNELKILSVSALNDANSVLEITFSKPISKLETSDVAVQNANTLARYGVKSAVLNSNGLIATVELYSHDDANQANPVLSYVTNYTVTVNADGTSLKTTFNRPAYVKERILDVDPSGRKIKIGAVTINVPKTTKFDYGDALGRKARVWYNSDRDLVNIVYEDETVVSGGLEITEDRAGSDYGEIEINDTKYDLAETGFKFYVNDSSVTFGNDGDEYDYARVFFNSTGEVELIQAYMWDDYLIVSEVEETVAVSYDDTEIDLEDYLVVKDGKQIAVSDLEEGDIIYFDADSNDGDGFAVVYNDSVSGEIEDVFSAEIRIDGTTYNFAGLKYNKPTQYLDGDDFEDVDSDVAEEFQAGGRVTLFLDHKGDAIYLTGEQAAVASNKDGFHLTDDAVIYFANSVDTRGTVELEGVDGAGEEQSYTIRIDSLDSVTGTNGKKYQVDKYFPSSPVSTLKIDKFGLNANHEIVALDENNQAFDLNGNLVAGTTATAWNGGLAIVDLDSAVDNSLIELKKNDSGKVVGFEFITPDTLSVAGGDLAVKLTDKFMNGSKLLSSTVVFDGHDTGTYNPDADDIVVTTWGALKDKGFKVQEATYYVNSDNEIKYLIIKGTDAEDTTEVNGVVTKVLRNTKLEITELTVLVDGVKKTYNVDKVTDSSINKGSLVALKVNDDNGQVEDINLNLRPRIVSGTVTDVAISTRTVQIDGIDYVLVSDGSVLNAKDVSDILVKALRDIKVGDSVQVSLDEQVPNASRFIDIVKIVPTVAAVTPITSATVSIPVPVVGEAAATTIAAGTGYTGTISWTAGVTAGNFVVGSPAATVVLTADATHSFTGAGPGAVTVPGSLSASSAVSGANDKTLTVTITYAAIAAAPTASLVSADDTDLVLTFSAPLYIGGMAIPPATEIKNQFVADGTVTITSATYNASVVTLVVTGASFGDTIKAKPGVLKDAAGSAYVPETMTFNGVNWQ